MTSTSSDCDWLDSDGFSPTPGSTDTRSYFGNVGVDLFVGSPDGFAVIVPFGSGMEGRVEHAFKRRNSDRPRELDPVVFVEAAGSFFSVGTSLSLSFT